MLVVRTAYAVQGTAVWASSVCLEPGVAAGLCLCPGHPAGRVLRGVTGLAKSGFGDSDALWLASGGRVSLSFHPGHHAFGRRNDVQLAITEPNLGLEGNALLQRFPWAAERPAALCSDQPYLTRNRK